MTYFTFSESDKTLLSSDVCFWAMRYRAVVRLRERKHHGFEMSSGNGAACSRRSFVMNPARFSGKPKKNRVYSESPFERPFSFRGIASFSTGGIVFCRK